MTKDPKYAHQAHLEVVKNRNTRWLPCPDTGAHSDTDGAIITIHPVGHAVTPATHSLFRLRPVVDAGACDHTQPCKNRQHRRSAIGNQWQGRAHYRQQAGHHGHIHKEIKKEHSHDPHPQKTTEMMTASE